MDSALLVKPDTVAAEKFLVRLEASQFLVDAAFWLQDPESREWRFVVASPVVDYSRPRYAYEWVQRVLNSDERPAPLQLNDISVVGNGDPTLRRLRAMLAKSSPDQWIRVRPGMNSEPTVGDALVFRVFPPAAIGPEVLDHETRFVSHVEGNRLFWLVGGPSELTVVPDDWFWCGYPQGFVAAQRKAKALNDRLKQRKARAVREIGRNRLAVIDNDGIHYVITTERNLAAAGQTAWTSAVIHHVPPGIDDGDIWDALTRLGSSARDAERTRVAKARGLGTLSDDRGTADN